MHAAQSKRHMHTDTLYPKNTHTNTELLCPQVLLKARRLIRRLKQRGPASLQLSNGGPLTQIAGVTKQLNVGSEKAGNWLAVITHNFSPILFKVPRPPVIGLHITLDFTVQRQFKSIKTFQ